MKLEDALSQIAYEGHLEKGIPKLIEYAAEDHVGGRDTGEWPNMSVYQGEGKILYAFIRLLKPTICVEIGVHEGGTTTHILSALDKNKLGILYSYDIDKGVGSRVPDRLKYRWNLREGQDALEVTFPVTADFVFEDGPHDLEFTKKMLEKLRKLKPTLLFTHDMYAHQFYDSGFHVMEAFESVFGVNSGVLPEGSTTGLGYYWGLK